MDHSPPSSARGASASPTVGHRSPLSDATAHAGALADIRSFPIGSTAIRVVSRAEACEDGHAAFDVYEDDLGYFFRCDPKDGRVVQVDRHEDRHSKARPTRPDSRHPVAELRSRALALARERSPSFAASRSAFHPMEGNRDRELYVFRWEDARGALSDREDPPYIEVGVYADGTLARFTDALHPVSGSAGRSCVRG